MWESISPEHRELFTEVYKVIREHQKPITLTDLLLITKKSKSCLMFSIRTLANSIPQESSTLIPAIWYDRRSSKNIGGRDKYLIFTDERSKIEADLVGAETRRWFSVRPEIIEHIYDDERRAIWKVYNKIFGYYHTETINQFNKSSIDNPLTIGKLQKLMGGSINTNYIHSALRILTHTVPIWCSDELYKTNPIYYSRGRNDGEYRIYLNDN